MKPNYRKAPVRGNTGSPDFDRASSFSFHSLANSKEPFGAECPHPQPTRSHIRSIFLNPNS